MCLYALCFHRLRSFCCRLVAEYLEVAPASSVAEAVETLAGPPLLHMVHSRHGATVACQVLAMATAKQRKKVIKAMKGEFLLNGVELCYVCFSENLKSCGQG